MSKTWKQHAMALAEATANHFGWELGDDPSSEEFWERVMRMFPKNAGNAPISIRGEAPGGWPNQPADGYGFSTSTRGAFSSGVIRIGPRECLHLDSRQYMRSLDVHALVLIDPRSCRAWGIDWEPQDGYPFLPVRLRGVSLSENPGDTMYLGSDDVDILLPSGKHLPVSEIVVRFRGTQQVDGAVVLADPLFKRGDDDATVSDIDDEIILRDLTSAEIGDLVFIFHPVSRVGFFAGR